MLVPIGDMDDLKKVKISFPANNRKTMPPLSNPSLVSIQNALIRIITKDIFLFCLLKSRIRNFPALNS